MLFANFAEAMAEGRGKAQAEFLRRTKTETTARRLVAADGGAEREERISAAQLRRGDRVVAEANDLIATDGEIVEGAATVDESAITGESAPVIREAGGDRSSVTGGTRVLSDRIVYVVSANPGETFLDRMIALVEGAQRQKTPNEIALSILLAGLTIIFVIAVATLAPFSIYAGATQSVVVLIALLVCLIPTTIGGLLSAIGIAGMDRVLQRNVLAMSGRAVEAAGDVDTLLLDKTGTITLGNRQATEIIPAPGVGNAAVYSRRLLASLADETPEGRSIVLLASTRGAAGWRTPTARSRSAAGRVDVVPFSAYTRMSGLDYADGSRIRKGAPDAVRAWVRRIGRERARWTDVLAAEVERIARAGGTPLLLADEDRIIGLHRRCATSSSPNMRVRFDRLRAMGIRTVMITGDNPLTAAAIARDAGVDDFLAEATPETKMSLIKREQSEGRLVAMTGDGTNDAPGAGASRRRRRDEQRDAGRERGGQHGRPRLRSHQAHRGGRDRQAAADDARFADDLLDRERRREVLRDPSGDVRRGLSRDGRAQHHAPRDPQSAILSAIIFNALIIIALIPLALRGVAYRPRGANAVLRENVLIYGLGGIIVPFVGIKAIDLILVGLHLTGAQ